MIDEKIAIEAYQNWAIKIRELTADTLLNYTYCIKDFEKFLNGKSFYEVTKFDINNYITEKSGKIALKTLKINLAAISSFYDFLAFHDKVEFKAPRSGKYRVIVENADYLPGGAATTRDVSAILRVLNLD